MFLCGEYCAIDKCVPVTWLSDTLQYFKFISGFFVQLNQRAKVEHYSWFTHLPNHHHHPPHKLLRHFQMTYASEIRGVT